jgi:hypothetical protein
MSGSPIHAVRAVVLAPEVRNKDVRLPLAAAVIYRDLSRRGWSSVTG